MRTREAVRVVAERLPRKNVWKIGGGDIGSYKTLRNTNILHLILNLFLKLLGRPKGFVFSAPSGLTRELHEMLDLSLNADSGVVDSLLYNFSSDITQEFRLAWLSVSQELRPLIDPNRVEAYDNLLSRIDKEMNRNIRVFHSQASSCLKGEFGFDRDFAIMGSLGERMFGAFVMKPLCQILTEFFDMNFVYVNPLEHLVPMPGFVGYRQIEPDIFNSVTNLRRLIKKENLGDATFVMPGFYMSSGPREKEIALMPYNGSDISAYLLAMALDVPPIFIKKLEGSAPTSICELQDFQWNKPSAIDSKPIELIANFVLTEMIRRKEVLRIFDTNTNSLCEISVGQRKVKSKIAV